MAIVRRLEDNEVGCCDTLQITLRCSSPRDEPFIISAAGHVRSGPSHEGMASAAT